MSDLRGALAISNDVHAELMEAVRDGREPPRVAAAAAARRGFTPSTSGRHLKIARPSSDPCTESDTIQPVY